MPKTPTPNIPSDFGQLLVNNLNRNTTPDNCIFDSLLQSALRFSIKTHEVYQKQKRKGKDIPYITHPLTVGLILAKAGADSQIVAAGILHDTIEDSIEEKKVTYEMLVDRFGTSVANMVRDVTETDKKLSWKERKAIAINHIEHMDEPSLWVKTADVISNLRELLADFYKEKDKVFDRFHASKEDTMDNHRKVLTALIKRWKASADKDHQNPLLLDLWDLEDKIKRI